MTAAKNVREALEEVLALSELATPGEWKVRVGRHEGQFFVQAPRLDPAHPYDVEVLGEDTTLYPTRRGDADLIVALVNLTRTHGPALLASLSATAAGECDWSSDFEGTWSTGCGHLYCINEGTPHENEMAYCCFCGKKTTETNRDATQESP